MLIFTRYDSSDAHPKHLEQMSWSPECDYSGIVVQLFIGEEHDDEFGVSEVNIQRKREVHSTVIVVKEPEAIDPKVGDARSGERK